MLRNSARYGFTKDKSWSNEEPSSDMSGKWIPELFGIAMTGLTGRSLNLKLGYLVFNYNCSENQPININHNN